VLEIGYGLLGCVPNMPNRVVVGSIRRHGNKVNSLQELASRQGCPDLTAFVEGGIVPDNGNAFCRDEQLGTA
jgi:hypothetical protein